jgi:hypothetical protein
MSGAQYKVVWPLGKRTVKALSYAQRLDNLEGKTVGELWDWVFRGEIIFPMVEEALAKRYPGIKFVDYRVFGNTHGFKESEILASLPDLLKKHGCDAVISGLGC